MLTNETTPAAREQKLRDLIVQAIRALLLEDDQTDTEFDADSTLAEIGLNSLTFAQLLLQLEDETGIDPFADGEAQVTDIHTANDLVKVYHERLALEPVT